MLASDFESGRHELIKVCVGNERLVEAWRFLTEMIEGTTMSIDKALGEDIKAPSLLFLSFLYSISLFGNISRFGIIYSLIG